MPKISVIVPAYNAESTIAETLKSVQLQTFSDFEVIVIDDGSTDRTSELVKEIDDPRIQCFSYPNGGLPTARNRGLDRAQGELITFLDADDLWTAHKLESQYQALQENPQAGLVYSWTLVMDDETRQLNPGTSVSHAGDVYSDLFQGNFIASGSNAMLRRCVFEQTGYFVAELKAVEDWEYWLRVARHFQFAVVRQYQVLYRQASQTMSSDIEQMRSHLLRVHHQELQASPKRLHSVKKRSLAYIYRYLAKLSLTRQQGKSGLKSAAQDLATALCFYPFLLQESGTQKLVAKLLLASLLPTQWAQALFNRMRALSEIRLNPQASS